MALKDMKLNNKSNVSKQSPSERKTNINKVKSWKVLPDIKVESDQLMVDLGQTQTHAFNHQSL